MNKKTILWTITIIILSITVSYGTLYYLQWRDEKALEKLKESKIIEIEEELTEKELLESLTNPEYKEKEISAEDIKSLELLKSETKPLSEQEIAKELELLKSLKAK